MLLGRSITAVIDDKMVPPIKQSSFSLLHFQAKQLLLFADERFVAEGT
jgi:hypothetical protein